jgi:hypothetical protein
MEPKGLDEMQHVENGSDEDVTQGSGHRRSDSRAMPHLASVGAQRCGCDLAGRPKGVPHRTN